MKTVVGLYSSIAEANKVKSALQAEGYQASHINVIDQIGEGYTGSTMPGRTSKDEPFTEKIKNFFTGFREHDDEHTHYADRIERVGALLSVSVPDDKADETAELLYQHGATGIENNYASTSRADSAALTGSSNDYSGSSAGTGDQVIPVVQEELVVGKKQVDRGGVRIYSHVVETPVSADISLHDERVVVDRRPVDRAATDADFNTRPGLIEVSAKGEEAVKTR